MNGNHMRAQFDATMDSDEDNIYLKCRAAEQDSIDGEDEREADENVSTSCLPDFHFSIVSEYDERLDFPDSLTILSNLGDKPVLVERKESDEENRSNSCDVAELPFSNIYAPAVKFNSFQRKVFIPGREVQVRIVKFERTVTTHLLSPNLYTIELTHGQFTWRIKRRYKHLSSLHQQLSLFRASLNIPFPMRSHKEKRATIKNIAIQIADEAQVGPSGNNVPTVSHLNGSGANNSLAVVPTSSAVKKTKKYKLPRFPNRPESLVPEELLPIRIRQLEEYLYNLLNSTSIYRNHNETINFVEVSNLSFIGGLGEKGKEGMVQKRTGSTRPGQVGCNFCGFFQQHCCVRFSFFCSDVLCGTWRNRWFFVKETCFGYIRPSDGVIRAVILFDQGFDVSTGIYHTGMRKGLQLLSNNRLIILKCWTLRKCQEWMQYLKETANTYARDFTLINPHASYAPVRSCTKATWYVDGSMYMEAVADAMEAATEEIYIADWWLSPEIFMKRSVFDGNFWSLENILLRKAKQGVKIFVLLYKEIEVALGINSIYTKQKLVNLHANIKVLRHPDHARAGVFFWAHHEKIVVVDQTYAFFGGLDLCYGRWDDNRHRLTDLGNNSVLSTSVCTLRQDANISKEDDDSAFGSRNSSRNMKNEPVVAHQTEQKVQSQVQENVELRRLSSTETPQTSLAPPISLDQHDLYTPEFARKNVLDKLKKRGKNLVHKFSHTDNERLPEIVLQPTELDDSTGDSEELQNTVTNDQTTSDPLSLNDLYGQGGFWLGKDYSNFILKDWVNLDAPFVDLVDRTKTPRMPWHDVGVCVVGASARDVARHFIQRWNAIKLEKMRDNNAFPYLIPKSYHDIRLNSNIVHKRQIHVSCQLLRSVSSWSCGFMEKDLVEQSIHNAYIDVITKAQHYIYIENQFFITMQMQSVGTRNSVENLIGDTIFNRIKRAYKERKTFRVYVIMPLLPGFAGDVGGTTGTAVRAITHWNYSSISRGRTAILSRLKAYGVKDPSEFISFHSLRNHSHLNNSPITELIYVHSKLLIADDRVVICGSANINDRSMIGKRDSEIAALITDEEFEDGRMNGQKFPSGKFAGSLRKYLFKEHLGLLQPDAGNSIDITDPVSDAFWNGVWRKIAKQNTEIYEEVFKCLPTDFVKTNADLLKYAEEPSLHKTDAEMAAKRLQKIQGFLVNLPLDFLANEVLTPPGASKEGILPNYVWT